MTMSASASTNCMSNSAQAKILDLTRAIGELDDLRITGEQNEIVGDGRRYSKAVAEGDRCASLQARGLNHPRRAGEIWRESGSERTERVIGDDSPVIALHAVVDLNEVHPAHHWPTSEQPFDARESRFFTIQPGENRPRVKAGTHRGSRARSSSKRIAIPVLENRPPNRAGDRRATSTISSSRNSKSISSPG